MSSIKKDQNQRLQLPAQFPVSNRHLNRVLRNMEKIKRRILIAVDFNNFIQKKEKQNMKNLFNIK